MKYISIVLPLGFFAVSVCGCAQQGTPKPTVPPAAQAPADIVPPAIVPPAAPSSPVPAAAGDTTVPAPVQNFGVAAAPAPPPPQASSADVAADYVLGPEDVINVNVWKEANFSGSLNIRPDGKISIPLLGDLPAAGLTPMDLAASIAEKLKKFVNDPTVTVTVTGVNSKRISLLGEVNRPGPVPMTRQFSMLQAISAAGGLTAYANRKHIYILRQVSGKEQKLFFDYNKALKTGDEQGIKLLPGDTIVVP